MPTESRNSARFRFFVFTCRDPRSDFRLPLVDALRHHHETYYIWLRRRPIVSGPTASHPAAEMSLPHFLRFIRRFRQDDAINVYFNSSNTYFPGLSTLLRLAATAGVWCLDMHDDLRYHNTGFRRWRETLIIWLLRRLSHVTVHAAPTLRELFKDSVHIGNASNMLPLARRNTQPGNVLIIASFDERFDFEFLSAVAGTCPTLQFHMYGWTPPHAAALIGQVKAVAARYANIHYHGPYEMADLPSILSRYDVSIAPYRTDTLLTRYIDPLRFYHCLNAGLEVVSSDIPQARYMRDWVHVVADANDCADTLAAIGSGAVAKQPAYAPITWEQRVDRLVETLRRVPRTISLSRRRAVRQRAAHGSAIGACRSLE